MTSRTPKIDLIVIIKVQLSYFQVFKKQILKIKKKIQQMCLIILSCIENIYQNGGINKHTIMLILRGNTYNNCLLKQELLYYN